MVFFNRIVSLAAVTCPSSTVIMAARALSRSLATGVKNAGSTTVSMLVKNAPGVVSGLCDAVYSRGLNVASSEMARVGQHFFIRMDVVAKVHDAKFDSGASPTQTMREELLSGSSSPEGIDCVDEGERMADSWRISATLELADTPGVLASTTKALAAKGADLIKLRSSVSSSDHTSTPLFAVQASWDVPNAVGKDELDDVFDALDSELGTLSTVTIE